MDPWKKCIRYVCPVSRQSIQFLIRVAMSLTFLINMYTARLVFKTNGSSRFDVVYEHPEPLLQQIPTLGVIVNP